LAYEIRLPFELLASYSLSGQKFDKFFYPLEAGNRVGCLSLSISQGKSKKRKISSMAASNFA
jgi:hypothetical protein